MGGVGDVFDLDLSLLESEPDVALRLNAEEECDELAVSMGRLGQLVPILVRSSGEGRFVVVSGWRRVAAARRLGWGHLKACCVGGDEAFALPVAVVDNLQRRNLSPIEEAGAVAALRDRFGASVEEVSRWIGRRPEWVASRLGLLNWPADVQQALHVGLISLAAARPLATISDERQRGFLLEHAVRGGASASVTSAWVQALEAGVGQMQAVSAAAGSERPAPQPVVVRSPCIVCGVEHVAGQLSYMPMCAACVSEVRAAVRG